MLYYLKELSDGMDEDFYDNLCTFFVSLDLSNFNPRKIPANEAKNELIRVGRSSTDDVIIENFEEFKKGVLCKMAENWLPKDLKLKTFQHNLLEKCERKQKKEKGKHLYYYILKKEHFGFFETLMADRDKEEIDVEDDTEELVEPAEDDREKLNRELFESIMRELLPNKN
jgi:hypothetical protein